MRKKRISSFNSAVTNTRSLTPKITSVDEIFKELDLSVMAVTETWLSGGPVQEKAFDTFENDYGIRILNRNRRTRGGVAILYRSLQIGLKEYRFRRKNHEILAARGFITRNKRPFYIFVAYIKPSMSSIRKNELLDLIIDAIMDIKAREANACICVTGDFNRLSPSAITDAHPSLVTVDSPPTRKNAVLDIMICNFAANIENVGISASLINENGVESDHGILYMEAKFEHMHDFKWISYKTRVITEEGKQRFTSFLTNVDWESLMLGTICLGGYCTRKNEYFE